MCELFLRKSTIMNKVIIEEMKKESWEAVQRIYNKGIATKNATFQTEAPQWEAWDQAHRKDCRLGCIIECFGPLCLCGSCRGEYLYRFHFPGNGHW